jgi:hypothetical protein
MVKPDTEAFRGLLVLAGLCAAAYLFACAAIQLMENTRRAEVAVLRSDLAAWQVSQLMQEAREITEHAARERGIQP